MVESVFANICVRKHMDRFTLCTKHKVDVQWELFARVHNIRFFSKFHQQINPSPKYHCAKRKSAEVRDEVADQLPLAAEGISQPAVDCKPGEFAQQDKSEKLPKAITAAAGDQGNGKGDRS